MCTVTWLRERGGYTLLCNRDESLSRKPALAPAVKDHRGVRFIAPEDGDHGGAWIAVNQFALSVCLLNRYQDLGADGTNHTSPDCSCWKWLGAVRAPNFCEESARLTWFAFNHSACWSLSQTGMRWLSTGVEVLV